MSQLFIGQNLIHLRNDRVSYLIHFLPGGVPMHLYWGKRLETLEPAQLIKHYGLPADGSFTTNKVSDMSIYGTLTFTDTDGEANGGDFATTSVKLENLPAVKLTDGKGWYTGEYEVTADVKLTKK